MFFSIVQIWWLVFLEPLGVQRRHVPHFEALNRAKVDLEAQGRDSTFTICHPLLKKAILDWKTAIVPIFFCLSVWYLQDHYGGRKKISYTHVRSHDGLIDLWPLLVRHIPVKRKQSWISLSVSGIRASTISIDARGAITHCSKTV